MAGPTAVIDGGGGAASFAPRYVPAGITAFGINNTQLVDDFRFNYVTGLEDNVNGVAIDKTGGGPTFGVMRALQAMFDNAPDGTLFVFPVNGRYRVEKISVSATIVPLGGMLNLVGRKNIQIKGNGSVLFSSLTAPNDFSISDGVIAADGKSIFSASAPFGPIKNSPVAWYDIGSCFRNISGGNTGTRTDASLVSADLKTIRFQGSNTAAPPGATNVSATFRSPDDRNRKCFLIRDCTNIRISGLNHDGRNWKSVSNGGTGAPGGPQWPYDPTLEAQHGFDVQGGSGIEIFNCHIRNPWGDGINLGVSGTKLVDRAYIHDNEIEYVGRQGITMAGLSNAVVLNNNVHDGNRHFIDMEPPGNTNHCLNVYVWKNTSARNRLGFMAISSYNYLQMRIENVWLDDNDHAGTFNIPVGGARHAPGPRWGPFYIINNRATTLHGTGTAGLENIPPTGNLSTYWERVWDAIPATVKFQYCDNIWVTGNALMVDSGGHPGMFDVWAQYSTGIHVHDNDLTNGGPPATATPPGRELYVVPFSAGTAVIDGGGLITAIATQPANTGVAVIDGGGQIDAVGVQLPVGSAVIDGGGLITAVGSSINTTLEWTILGSVRLGSPGVVGGSGFGQGPFGRGAFGGTFS